jgi:dihydrofolate reductase
MRKIINSTYITLDGAIEDPQLWPNLGDAAKSESFDAQMELLDSCDTILMGRRTYETFAGAWPARSGDAMSDSMNAMQKLVVSATLRDPAWNNTSVVARDALEAIRTLKAQPGKNIVQYGIGPLTFSMLEYGLLDEFRLWIHPIVLGKKGAITPAFLNSPPAILKLLKTQVLGNGVVILRYGFELA